MIFLQGGVVVNRNDVCCSICEDWLIWFVVVQQNDDDFFGGRSALLTLATTTFCNTIFDPFWWTTALEGSGSRPQSCCTVAQYTQDCNVVKLCNCRSRSPTELVFFTRSHLKLVVLRRFFRACFLDEWKLLLLYYNRESAVATSRRRREEATTVLQRLQSIVCTGLAKATSKLTEELLEQ